MQCCFGNKANIPTKSRFDIIDDSSDEEDIWWE